MLRHVITRKIKGISEDFLELFMDPERFLKLSEYVEEVVHKEDNIYEVIFKWVKWGMIKRYWVKFKAYRDANTVVYESVPDSDHYMVISVSVARNPDERYFNVRFSAEMEVGILERLLGKKDFEKFVESLLDTAIKGYLEKQVGKHEENIDCRECAFYETVKSYCYVLDKRVEDPAKPPCNGREFKKA